MSTVTESTFSPCKCKYKVFIPERVSKAISFLSVSPYSYTYLPTQRLALPHIMASEPSALKMRMLKSPVSEGPIRTSPSLPMPVCGLLHSFANASGCETGYFRVLT